LAVYGIWTSLKIIEVIMINYMSASEHASDVVSSQCAQSM